MRIDPLAPCFRPATAPPLHTRRTVLKASLIAGAAIALPAARAQTPWPNRPVKVVVSFPPGGSSDFVARALAPSLFEKFGQPFVVDNRPGAGGMIAARQLKREPPDGHTLIVSNNAPFTIAPLQFTNAGYDPVKDFAHIAYLGSIYGGCVANPKTGLRSLADLVTRAKAEPGRLTFGSSGVGSIGHLVGEWFKRLAGIDLLHVAYKGAGLLRQDLAAGVVDLQFEGLLGNLAMIQSGALQALGSASPERQRPLPDVPTFREQGFDMSVEFWHGLSAPAGLPTEIGHRLETELAPILARQDVLDRLATYGIFYQPMSRDRFNQLIVDQLKLWKPLVDAAGVSGQTS